MKWNDPEFLEAIRLIRKFYPESQAVISTEKPLGIDDFLEAMTWGDWHIDASCEPFNIPPAPRLELAERGGIEGTDDVILTRLIDYIKIKPSGRVVVVPDCILNSAEDRKPFVCHSRSLINRAKVFSEDSDQNYIFDGSSDTIVVFESGEAFVVDHDDRFYWSKSKPNKIQGKS